MNVTLQSRPAKLPGANDPCWCGSGTKYKKCHRAEDSTARGPVVETRRVRKGVVSPRRPVPAHIPRPDYADGGEPQLRNTLDPATKLARMRSACRAAAEVLNECAAALKPGVTTDAIDVICHEGYIKRGGFPSTLNYPGHPDAPRFPKALCTSVNEVVLHGIPDSRPLENGDIINLDITIYLNGVHGDCSATFPVGDIDTEAQRLLKATNDALYIGIEAAKPGRRINDIGRAIEEFARKSGYGVVREFCGHGIGEMFHTAPTVPHFFDARADTVIQEGMLFTIEPMLTLGSPQLSEWDDGWTIVTRDGRRSAQFEHTVYITANGAEILTRA